MKTLIKKILFQSLRDGTGRHPGFRNQCTCACRFESDRRHFLNKKISKIFNFQKTNKLVIFFMYRHMNVESFKSFENFFGRVFVCFFFAKKNARKF